MQENIIFGMPVIAMNLKTISMDKYGNPRGIHFHKAVELVQVNEGEIVCHIDNDEILLKCNDILLINSGVIHKLVFNSLAGVTYIQIDLDKYLELSPSYSGYLNKFIMNSTAKKFLLLQEENELTTIFGNIKKEFEEKKFCYKDYIRTYIYGLVAFMKRNFLLSDLNTLCDGNKLTELVPVVEYIDKNYNTKFSLDMLGEIINCDRFRLCRLFKAATHLTLFEYINFVRILSAEEMLIKSRKNISEIAFDCGFSSIQYFNRVFKESRGYSPMLYKKLFFNDIK